MCKNQAACPTAWHFGPVVAISPRLRAPRLPELSGLSDRRRPWSVTLIVGRPATSASPAVAARSTPQPCGIWAESAIDRRERAAAIPPASNARAPHRQGVTVRAGIPVARFRPLIVPRASIRWTSPSSRACSHEHSSAIASMSATLVPPSRGRQACGVPCNRFGENIHNVRPVTRQHFREGVGALQPAR